MIDYYGRWTAETDYTEFPEDKMCDCDRIARAAMEDGYKPETDYTNLTTMVLLYFDSPDNYGEYDPDTGCGGYGDSFTVEECLRYVEESGGWREFDYVA